MVIGVILFMTIAGDWCLLMVIILVAIGVYFIGGYYCYYISDY
jgi:hypothetical protein